MNITEWLVKWFVENSSFSEKELNNMMEENYFDNGCIDSFGFMMLLAEIENEFNINFKNDDFSDRKFSTILGLSQVISEQIK